MTPLTFSLLADPMADHMVRRPLRLAGLDALAALPVLHLHASHVYVNAALVGSCTTDLNVSAAGSIRTTSVVSAAQFALLR